MSATYIRTHLFRHAEIQAQVAQAIRTASVTFDRFGDEDLYAKWAEHLKRAGATEEAAVEQASRVAGIFVAWAARQHVPAAAELHETSIHADEPLPEEGPEEAYRGTNTDTSQEAAT